MNHPAPSESWSKRFLPKGENVSWGVGTLGTITMISSVSSLYLFFLVGVMKVSPATAGLLIFVSKIFDMVSDPAMGWLSDRTNTRWGRRRPFLLGAAFICPLCMIALFSVPTDGGVTTWTIIYIEVALLIYTVALTAFNVPYLAMPAEMTDDYHERSNIMSFRAAFLVGGSFVGSALAGLILSAYGGGVEAYRMVSYVLAAVVFVSMMICFFGTRRSRFTHYQPTKVKLKNQLRLFLVNKPFLVLGIVKAIQFLQISSGSAAGLFFFISVMQRDEALLFPFGLALTLGSVLSLGFWLPIIKRFGKKEVFMAGLAIQCLLYLSWTLSGPEETLAVFVLRAFSLGVISGGVLICGQSMITDTINLDRKISGINREGTFSAVFSFVEKSTHALGPVIVGFLLAGFGFDQNIPRGEAQPDSAQLAIYIGQAWLPAACSLAMIIGLLFYDLDEEKLEQADVHALAKET